MSYNHITPDHYKGEKEVWERMIDIWGVDAFITFCEMNAFKYHMRMGKKPDQPVHRDLAKAQWYLDKAQECKNT